MASSRRRRTKTEDDLKPTSKGDLLQQLDEVDLTKINEVFGREKGKRLSSGQLRKVLQVIAKVTIPEVEFEIMFMKMNIKRDGFVTWDEFISFLILCFQQQEIKKEFVTLEAPIPRPAALIRSNHRYTINRITYCPTVRSDRTITWHDGSLMTCSRDGTINYWSLDLQPERFVKSTCPNLKVQQTWVTDMTSLPDVSVVCTSSTERDLRFYDTSARKFDLRVIFTMIEYAISTMNYHFSENANEESKLILGDMGGNIHVVFIQSLSRGPFRSKLGLPLLEVLYSDVVKGLVEGFRVVILPNQHSEFIRQIKYYPALHSIISCSDCSKSGLMMRDLDKNKDAYVYKTGKGSWCFDVTERVHIIASGGSDCLVRLWNPFVPRHPTATLYGHHSGVVSVILQDEGQRLYSLSQDKCVKVWDTVSQSCLQNYLGIPAELGEHSDMTTLYNPESRQWIIGSTMLAVVPLSPNQSSDHTDGFTHTAGVSVVLYNPLFKVVVTCGLDSNVIVWNPWDGRRMMAIREAHTKSVHAELIPIEITAASFDPGWQRLITGAHDGTLKIWNFNTGTCLRNMKIAKNCEIKSLIWLKNRILAMGWNRCITEFADSTEVVGGGGEFSKNWDKRHAEDISCAAVREAQTLVTSTYNGELIMWRLETGQPYKQFNVSDPTTRIKIQFKPVKHKEEVQKAQKATRKSVVQGLMTSRGTGGATQIKTQGRLGASSEVSDKIRGLRARRVSTVVVPEGCVPLRKLAIHAMLFLQSRPMDPSYGTLLVALENGAIQVWSHHTTGGFITSFSAIHKAGDYVISMASDVDNEFLFTGTSVGYIKTWLIKDYCVPESTIEHVNMPRYRLMFPFLWGDLFVGRAARIAQSQPKPTLLNSYKGHVMPVSGLSYIDEAKILLSVDFTARMWSLGGRYLQTLGTFKSWKPVYPDPQRNKNFEFTTPPEIMRVASSTTFRVLRGGATARQLTWKQMQAKVEKELMHIDFSKIYGERLKEPILGQYFTPSSRTTQTRDIIFDTSFPHIPVYQHLIMPQAGDVKMPNIRPITDNSYPEDSARDKAKNTEQ